MTSKLPLYPIFFAPVPVLAMHINYLWEVGPLVSLRMAGASLLAAAMLLAFLCLSFSLMDSPNPTYAGISTLLLTITWCVSSTPGFPFWFLPLLVLVAISFLIPRGEEYPRFTYWANLVGFFMLSWAVLMIAVSGITRYSNPQDPQGTATGPDIYYILLDSYTSHTVLQERFGYDNAWFLQELEALGFTTGDCSSRYTYTDQTLASLWNGGMEVSGNDQALWDQVQHSRLRSLLEAEGYNWIAFATGFAWDEIRDAAYFMEPVYPPGLNEFEIFFWDQTPLKYLELDGDRLGDLHRARILYTLEHLPLAASLPGGQFTFAHLLPPHPPFVFDSAGSAISSDYLLNPDWNGNSRHHAAYTPEDYAAGYTAEVEFISWAILEPVRTILEASPEPPLIILAGDHGPWYSSTDEEAHAILCTVYGDIPPDPTEAFTTLLIGR